uniref:S-acyltransferase n=1 Tax=Leersia perrieri TaxID=77586 RepID=A0A0D9VR19_9ORYZ
MRKHGWQLPYHPLQVVAIAVFLALGFAFYVFFVPFVGRKAFQYVAMGLYTPLITSVVLLYIWCAATNPGDPGIFKSAEHPKLNKDGKQSQKNSEHGLSHGGKMSNDGFNAVDNNEKLSSMLEQKDSYSWPTFSEILCFPFSCLCKRCFHADTQSSEQHMSEEGMFFCSLCEAEWLNNCIGKRNYKGFFLLMTSAVLLWLSGVLVLILCIVERGEFSRQIVSKLGSSFSTVVFIIVVATCTVLAMIATIPLAQLFTYDYIIALREQEEDQQEEIVGHQSPQMSIISSVTGFSTASSFGPLHRGSWCTPPRLFLEDQFDVIPPEVGVPQNSGSRTTKEDEGTRRRTGTVKISPWTLARLNAEEVSKAAAQARKKSKILKPIARHNIPISHDINTGGKLVPKADNNRRPDRRFPAELSLDPLTRLSASGTESNFSDTAIETSGNLAPLQFEARSAFQPSTAASTRNAASSPESSFDSPDLHPFRLSSCTADEMQGVIPHPAAQNGIKFSRSTSDGYEASGGEDSDRIPSRIVHRSSNWANAILSSGQGGGTAADQHMPSSEG